MRRSSYITVLLLSFSIFTFVGFRFAMQNSRSAALASHPAGDTQNTRTILVHVDDLQSQQPVLKSVWVAVQFQSKDQTVLSFVPLFPAPAGQPSTASLSRSFSMTRSGEPSASFWRRLKSHQIRWDHYILVDDAGLAQSSTWLDGFADPNIPVTGSLPALPASDVLESGCRYIQGTPIAIAQIDRTNSNEEGKINETSLDALFIQWHELASAQQPVKCEVVLE